MINASEARKLATATTETVLAEIADLIRTAASQKKFEVKVTVHNNHLVTCQKALTENGYDIICNDPEVYHSNISIRW